MKNRLFYLIFVTFIPILVIWQSCEENPIDNEEEPLIFGVFPTSNPIGGPVKIKGAGFTESTQLYFDGTQAIIEYQDDSLLTTKVPSGISGLGISVKVANGSKQYDLEDSFDVLTDYPNDLPLSPPRIIIPSSIPNSLLPFSVSGAYWIEHVNIYDVNHEIGLMIWRQSDDFDDFTSYESYKFNGTFLSSPATTDGQLLLNYNDSTKEVNLSSIEIDRSSSRPDPHPFESDEYFASYFQSPDIEVSNELASSIGDRARLTENFLLLESKTTGRQYLFLAFCRYDGECGE